MKKTCEYFDEAICRLIFFCKKKIMIDNQTIISIFISMRIAYLSTFYPFRRNCSVQCRFIQRIIQNNENKAFNFYVNILIFLFRENPIRNRREDNGYCYRKFSCFGTRQILFILFCSKRNCQIQTRCINYEILMSYLAPSLGGSKTTEKKGCKVISILDNVLPHERNILIKLLQNGFETKIQGLLPWRNR